MNILDSVVVSEDENLFPNLYFSPELEDTFIYILCRIPLWSNLMVETFQQVTQLQVVVQRVHSKDSNMITV